MIIKSIFLKLVSWLVERKQTTSQQQNNAADVIIIINIDKH